MVVSVIGSIRAIPVMTPGSRCLCMTQISPTPDRAREGLFCTQGLDASARFLSNRYNRTLLIRRIGSVVRRHRGSVRQAMVTDMSLICP